MRRGSRLSAAEFTLLGLIAQSGPDAQVHGYDLNRHLVEGAPGAVIRIEPGMLYHYLKKLARLELISSMVVPQAGKPDRHVHSITGAGRARFEAWLAEPVQATREMRLDFLLKLWFARQAGPEAAAELIGRQREILQGLVASLEGQLAERRGAGDPDRFAREVLGLRLAQNRAALAWLDDLDAG